MKYRPKKDFQLEHWRFLSVLLFPTDYLGYSAALPKAFAAK